MVKMCEKRIGVIGCGNMGSAIIRGLTFGVSDLNIKIFINDRDIKKTTSLGILGSIEVTDLKTLVRNSDILIFAIKPQDSDFLFEDIKSYMKDNILIISVMAGVTISSIMSRIANNIPVVRAMPNMPGIIGSGITCFSCNKYVSNSDVIQQIFSGIGKVVEVKEEDMDIITAISGSGPAYFFYFADALIKAGVSNGLTSETAKELVLQTFLGSAKLLIGTNLSAEDLVSSVASKGGTTEAALSVFINEKMDQIILSAVEKAKQRSKELSQG